jgi:hypothetical protein
MQKHPGFASRWPSWEGGDGLPDDIAWAEITRMPLAMDLLALNAFIEPARLGRLWAVRGRPRPTNDDRQ